MPFVGERFRLYYRARYAIGQALRAMGVQPGMSFAVPAYHCGTELGAFDALGIRLRFYRVDRFLTVDENSLAAATDSRTAGVLVTHYFGLPTNLDTVQAFCQRRNLGWIEDCAHTLFGQRGDRFLGTFGSVGVFSLRKLLLTGDGGALLVNDRSIPLPAQPGRPPWRVTLGPWLSALSQPAGKPDRSLGHDLQRTMATGLHRVLRRAKSLGPRRPPAATAQQDPIEFDRQQLDWGISRLTEQVLATVNVTELVARRRGNFQFLLQQLPATESIRPLIPQLPAGVCPWVFPLLVSSPDSLLEHTSQCGVEMKRFWRDFHPACNPAEFPDALFLKRHVVALPVHQRLHREDLMKTVDALNTWRPAAVSRAAGYPA